MQPQFSAPQTQTPIRVDAEGKSLMPEFSDSDYESAKVSAADPPHVRKRRQPKQPQADATQLDLPTQAKQWLKDHPNEAEMLRSAQMESTGDILADAGIEKRWYSTQECAAFFDKSTTWLYWGMRPRPKGGALFLEERRDPRTGEIIFTERRDERSGEVILDDDGRPELVPDMAPIKVERLGDPKTGDRRFDIPTIRKFARSAYYQNNIKEPTLRAVLERLVVAERGGDWTTIPIPSKRASRKDKK